MLFQGRFSGYKNGLCALIVFISVLWLAPRPCRGYTIPAEQLAEFMAANFSCFETVLIDQITQQESLTLNDIGEERVFHEKIAMQIPANYSAQILEQTADKIPGADTLFRQLLIANPKEKVLLFLQKLGIDTRQVVYTRLEGTIAYQIGGKSDTSPRILIEKNRFVPLLLVYRPGADPQGKMVSVRFKDYRAFKDNKDKWYPYNIAYTIADTLKERYLIQELSAGTLAEAAGLKMPKPGVPAPTPAPAPAPAPVKTLTPEEKERLKKIIEAFEKKYE